MEEQASVLSSLSDWKLVLVLAALISSAGSGVMGLTQDTSDRYHGADAIRDLALRDERIAEIRRDFEKHVGSCGSEHKDFESRLRALERHVHLNKEYKAAP